MGCCGSGVPDVILPDPLGPDTFKVQKAGILGSSYDVYNKFDQKWLYIRNESSFWDKHNEFTLENFVRTDNKGQVLGYAKIEGTDPEFSKFKTKVEDSDGDFHILDDSDNDEDTEYKCKMKWKIKKEA